MSDMHLARSRQMLFEDISDSEDDDVGVSASSRVVKRFSPRYSEGDDVGVSASSRVVKRFSPRYSEDDDVGLSASSRVVKRFSPRYSGRPAKKKSKYQMVHHPSYTESLPPSTESSDQSVMSTNPVRFPEDSDQSVMSTSQVVFPDERKPAARSAARGTANNGLSPQSDKPVFKQLPSKSARHASDLQFSAKPASDATRKSNKEEAKPPAVDPREDQKGIRAPVAATERLQRKRVARSSSVESSSSSTDSEPEEVVTKYVKLEKPVDAASNVTFEPISEYEKKELELALQLNVDSEDDGWRADWSGNLALVFEHVPNPEARRRNPGKSEHTRPFHEWAGTSDFNAQMLRSLLIEVHNMEGTPYAAKLLIRWAYSVLVQKRHEQFPEIIRRISYDPAVLQEDGWVTKRSKLPEGATGGAHHIGTKLVWQHYEAVVIAYVHDDDIGDLWKAIWLEDAETFDLEAEELERGIRKWKRKFKPQDTAARDRQPGSARFAAVSKYTVEGIEHGIVLAATYHPLARQGLLWPARVMHTSEAGRPKSQTKRSSARQKVGVVFLAPYWNALDSFGQAQSSGDAFSHIKTKFSSGPLLEVDSVDVSEETIQKYPHDPEKGLNIDRLRAHFKFTGLPKSAFQRYLDSHRLALALKMYARQELKVHATVADDASAALLETHPLSIRAAKFPPALLHLPFQYILSHLPPPTLDGYSVAEQGEEMIEPVLQLGFIMKAMEPPSCWGVMDTAPAIPSNASSLPNGNSKARPFSPGASLNPSSQKVASRSMTSRIPTLGDVASEYLRDELFRLKKVFPISLLLGHLEGLISQLWRDDDKTKSEASECTIRWEMLSSFLRDCLWVKGHGEDIIRSTSDRADINVNLLSIEWSRACERLYKEASCQFSHEVLGNGTTVVITDARCNQHITSNGSVERPVRLPAALKAVRMAKTELSDGAVHIAPSLKEYYIDEIAPKFIQRAHSKSYIERMKLKCSVLTSEMTGAPLTEDSEGEGGADTNGSQGSYAASVAAVAAAIKGVDMVVGGQVVNGFCVTRPPGHHAGRELHPMKTTSNGFCILNPAACAAIYAATPVKEGGMGLRRICVIDFDVHHGNGTQDILCSTEDPRFLYISLHAGGPQFNGYDSEDDSDTGFRTSIGSRRQEIFPGRCGDKSPHRGVLNIPLGGRFTASAVGDALVSRVVPAVEDFSPDLIILSAGFDGHQNDPLGLGGLTAANYGHITGLVCEMAHKFCGGRVLSILEGGYGVPCCRPQRDLFLPQSSSGSMHMMSSQLTNDSLYTDGDEDDEPRAPPVLVGPQRPQPSKVVDLGDELPEDMDDQMPYNMQKGLERCHAEGFIDCVFEHVKSLGTNNRRISAIQQVEKNKENDASME